MIDTREGKKKKMKRNGAVCGGFTYVEVILSVFLLSIGIIAVMILIGQSIRESIAVKDQQIASLLAQEGTELVRNLRDNNWAKSKKTFAGGFPVNSQVNCRLDINSTAVSNCIALANRTNGKQLYLDDDFYTHTAGDATKFYRKIGVSYSCNDNNPDCTAPITRNNADTAVITSMVVWKSGSFPAVADCNTSAKCAYEQTTLTRWGEK